MCWGLPDLRDPRRLQSMNGTTGTELSSTVSNHWQQHILIIHQTSWAYWSTIYHPKFTLWSPIAPLLKPPFRFWSPHTLSQLTRSLLATYLLPENSRLENQLTNSSKSLRIWLKTVGLKTSHPLSMRTSNPRCLYHWPNMTSNTPTLTRKLQTQPGQRCSNC